MILTAHQPVYLPWLGLFHKIALADTFVSFNQVQYLPKDWNNRNKIKTGHGAVWLTVPVLRLGHREKVLTDIEINNNTRWPAKHWRSIYLNYKKTPYFKQYSDFFEDTYLQREWKYLADLNDYMLKWFLNTLDIKTNFIDSRELCLVGKKGDLVFDMCKKLNADIYVFGALGKNYADVELFQGNGIDVYFQDYKHPEYPQQQGDFISHLSVIDLLFNCGPRSLDILFTGNKMRDDIIKLFQD
jgi:hypothetical protein